MVALTRGRLETPADLKRENDIAGFIASAYRAKFEKLNPYLYPCDTVFYRGKEIRMFANIREPIETTEPGEDYAEIKCRDGLNLRAYPEYEISEGKMIACRRFINEEYNGLVYVPGLFIVVRFKEGVYFYREDFKVKEKRMGGRTDRKLPYDFEPMELLPIDKFVRVAA